MQFLIFVLSQRPELLHLLETLPRKGQYEAITNGGSYMYISVTDIRKPINTNEETISN